MGPTEKGGRSLREAVLGLDVGMTGTRASLMPLHWKNQDDRDPIQINRPRSDLKERERAGSDQYSDCDFPATAFPFQVDNPPRECLGFAAVSYAESLPLKMYCYFIHTRNLYLGGNPDDAQYWRDVIPQIDDFWRSLESSDQAFQQTVVTHLENIFLEHLMIVRDCSRQRAAHSPVRITKLAVTIPHNWGEDMLDIYLDLLARVWDDVNEQDIELIYESEAVGHWLLRLNTEQRRNETSQRIILADFGGHTLNVAVLAINRHGGQDRRLSFFSYEDNNCYHGGSEMHTSWFKKQIGSQVKQRHLTLTDAERQHLYNDCMKFYRSNERSRINGSSFWVEGRKCHSQSEAGIQFKFPAQVTKPVYKMAFGEPLGKLNKTIRKYGKLEGRTDILLSGGSFRNSHVLATTLDAVKQAGLENVDWIDVTGPSDADSSIVSKGAAMALVNTITVPEFMSQAVFAIHYGKLNGDNLPIVLHKNKSVTQRFYANGRKGDTLWIKCAPSATCDAWATHISEFAAFQFYYLGWQTKGDYEVSMRYETGIERGDRLILELLKLDGTQNSLRRAEALPIYYDAGACVCFVDMDKHEMEKLQVDSMRTNGTGLRKTEQLQKRELAVKEWEQGQKDPGSALWKVPETPPAKKRPAKLKRGVSSPGAGCSKVAKKTRRTGTRSVDQGEVTGISQSSITAPARPNSPAQTASANLTLPPNLPLTHEVPSNAASVSTGTPDPFADYPGDAFSEPVLQQTSQLTNSSSMHSHSGATVKMENNLDQLVDEVLLLEKSTGAGLDGTGSADDPFLIDNSSQEKTATATTGQGSYSNSKRESRMAMRTNPAHFQSNGSNIAQKKVSKPPPRPSKGPP